MDPSPWFFRLCHAVHTRRTLAHLQKRGGKITLYTLLGGTLALALFGIASFEVNVPRVSADDVTTSVTVLNTPPVWTIDAEESPESSAANPTNQGTAVTWVATATDSNSENYYLIICKTSGAPTANSSAVPTCAGGSANRWAISSFTVSGAQATAATTTTGAAQFAAENNDWYAWVCDANASLPRCNATYKQGTASTASPFVVNHPPVFVSVANDSPVVPNASITWTSVAYDNDVQGGADTVRLIVCKAADFNGSYCGVGGTWATSTLAASNAATSSLIAAPAQDKSYDGYVYMVDSHGLAATSTVHGSNSSFVVSNVAPTISPATISLVDPVTLGNITLTATFATSGPYQVKFSVSDDNSCLNASSGNEITSAITNIYRSGVSSTSCAVSGDYNTNSCYPSVSPSTHISCSQDVGSCSGASDPIATWTCTFPLWYNADPTDASTPWTAENWLATVQATDDNSLNSGLIEASSGNDVASFLAFNVTNTSIGFGSLEPGQFNDPLSTTTDLIALGNVGLDETIYGDTMCTTWSAPDSCDVGGPNAATKIPIANQKVATSSVAYASSFAYALTGSTSPTSVAIRVLKTTVTSTPETKYNYWGINIPSSITLAGNYTGQDTIIAVKSPAAFW